MNIKILVVVQHRLIGAALSALLQTMKDFRVIGIAMNAEEGTAMMETKRPKVALIDGDLLKRQKDSTQQLQQLARVALVPVLVLASESKDRALMRIAWSGAASVVLKDAAPAELHRAIKTVAEGGTYFSRAVAEDSAGSLADGSVPLLTSRQGQILQLLAEGRSTKEVAADLGLSPRTVESHRSHIMERLGVHHLAGLIQYAIRTGIVGNG